MRSGALEPEAKLTIRIAFGVELPFSVSIANRTQDIDETVIKGNFDFTFEIARIGQAFCGRSP